jgi:hypothetical protein
MRDKFKDSGYYKHTERFIAKYDNPAFDASKPKLELALFAPLVRAVMAEPRQSIYKAVVDQNK